MLIGLAGSSSNTFDGNRITDTGAWADAQKCVWVMTDSSANVFDHDHFGGPVQCGTVTF